LRRIISPRPVSFDRLARPYRWLEYLCFGRALERCRFALLPELGGARRVLLYGDGDGRFLARLLRAYPGPETGLETVLETGLEIDAVDSSRAMLRIAEARLTPHARARVRFHHQDALRYMPSPGSDPGELSGARYDLVITHFFFDCFHQEELLQLLDRIRPHLAPNARWLVSEFAIPQRALPALAARAVVGLLYTAFRLLAGLRANHLPDYAAVLAAHGFLLSRRTILLGGLLHCELWRLSVS
jgi:ubiquinone/menaquinone biosynthesis C-methylase UbiE